MDKDKYEIKVNKFIPEDESFDLVEDVNDYVHGYSKQKIWISEIYDDLYLLLNSYIIMDDRLKWVNISDIMYSPFSDKPIKNDYYIQEFINILLDELKYISELVQNKKLEILEDNLLEYESLIILNKNKIYSRIAYVFEQRYCSTSLYEH